MSVHHAQLQTSDGEAWTIEDQASKNGTFVNGTRIQRATLEDGDVVNVGNTFWVYRGALVCLNHGDQAPETRHDAMVVPSSLRTMHGALERDFQLLARVARSETSVLIHGETGTGKELTARAVHELSGRKGPFIPVNCGALAKNLLESELFGARKGAYSGATHDRQGLVRAAHQGTLFLDEIGELPADAQSVLLRVLEEKEVLPVGGTHPVAVDLRVVAATHRDLHALMDANAFRPDLYARLIGFQLTLPSLVQRREDLGLLVANILSRIGGLKASKLSLQRSAARALFQYSWPFNIRELARSLELAIATLEGDEIRIDSLPPPIREAVAQHHIAEPSEPLPADLRAQLEVQLQRHQGNISAVARSMSTSRSQIRRMIKRLNIDLSAFRARYDRLV